MARSYSGSTSNYFSTGSAAVADTWEPLTIAGWATLEGSTGAGKALFGFFGPGMQYVEYHQTGGVLNAVTYDGAWRSASVTAPSFSTYFHWAGVFDGSSSRTIYLNGTTTATNTTYVSRGDLTSCYMGAYYQGGIYAPHNGLLGEIGVWDVALTQDEIVALSKGVSPLFVRKSSLISYYDLIDKTGNALDRMGIRTLTQTGTVASGSHPSIIYPSAQILQFPPAAAGGGGPSVSWNGVTSYNWNGVTSFNWNGVT